MLGAVAVGSYEQEATEMERAHLSRGLSGTSDKYSIPLCRTCGRPIQCCYSSLEEDAEGILEQHQIFCICSASSSNYTKHFGGFLEVLRPPHIRQLCS